MTTDDDTGLRTRDKPHPYRAPERQYGSVINPNTACYVCGYPADNEIHDDPREGQDFDWHPDKAAATRPHPYDPYTQPPLQNRCRVCLSNEDNPLHDMDTNKLVPNINAERAALGLPPYEAPTNTNPTPTPVTRRRFAPRSSAVRPVNAMRYTYGTTTPEELRAFDERIDVVTSSNTGQIFFIYVDGHPVEPGNWIVRTPGLDPALPHSGSELTILSGRAFHLLFTELPTTKQ